MIIEMLKNIWPINKLYNLFIGQIFYIKKKPVIMTGFQNLVMTG